MSKSSFLKRTAWSTLPLWKKKNIYSTFLTWVRNLKPQSTAEGKYDSLKQQLCQEKRLNQETSKNHRVAESSCGNSGALSSNVMLSLRLEKWNNSSEKIHHRYLQEKQKISNPVSITQSINLFSRVPNHNKRVSRHFLKILTGLEL